MTNIINKSGRTPPMEIRFERNICTKKIIQNIKAYFFTIKDSPKLLQKHV